jgi:XTP/dITP diphosphohydrolase
MQLIFATHNQHKADEVKQILGNTVQFATLKEVNYHTEIPEPFDTLEKNSLIKAQTIADTLQCNCFSEDTGLFIEALHGEPGVYSARYAGEKATSQQNIDLVLQKMQNQTNRKAYFKTVATLIINQQVYQFEGICSGEILTEQSGTKGFGYDPIFKANAYEVSFADCTDAEKNAVSHRRIAIEKMLPLLNL